ncbi:DsbA family oxidoreductase [Halorarum halobium]|uniref:DsbA family oxidoreductase n=1 Tax=Halorarum halobium TaxID=3075121 RepID=UPI0028B1E7EB|nr:DsbA family protein [Halobaculum sp. XH14]
MSTNQSETVAVYADFVCPFCYLGRASLNRYRDGREADLEVDWRFFDLRAQKRGPDGEIDDSVDDGKDEAYFEQVRENVARLREEYGAEEMLDLDGTPDVDSWDAQQAALFVKREHDAATFRAFYDAVIDAYWTEGREIGDVDVLADLAADAGLDPDPIRAATEDEELAAELRSRFEETRQRGVTGVPTFVADGRTARGAVPPSHLERLVEGS